MTRAPLLLLALVVGGCSVWPGPPASEAVGTWSGPRGPEGSAWSGTATVLFAPDGDDLIVSSFAPPRVALFSRRDDPDRWISDNLTVALPVLAPGTYPVGPFGAEVMRVEQGDMLTNTQASTGHPEDRVVIEGVDRDRVWGTVRFHARRSQGPWAGYVDEAVSVFEARFVAGVPAEARAALAPRTETATVGGVYVPRLSRTPTASARLEGVLVRWGPCLRVVNEGAEWDFLVAWGPAFLVVPGDPVQVFDVRNGRSVAVGDSVVLGGVGGSDRQLDGLLAPLPEACPGEVWEANEFGS